MDKPKNAMRLIIIVALFLIFTEDSKGQAVDTSLVTMQTDKITGRKSIASKPMTLRNESDKDALLIYVLKSNANQSIIFVIKDKSGSISCTQENDAVNFLFSDDSKMQLDSNGKFNCQGESVLYFHGVWGREGKLNELKSKPLSAIRIWGMSNHSDGNLNNLQAENFMKALRIVDEYKF